MRKLFGTDGVRGVGNEKLTPELCFQLGQAAGIVMARQGAPMRVVVGRDTRRSGPMLGAALVAGFCSAGVDAVTLGIVPTGAISYAVRTGDFHLGIVISASHNPAPDNGVKFLAHDGRKVTDAFEAELESLLGSEMQNRPTGASVGHLAPDTAIMEGYLDMLEALVPERLDGMKVALDAAHGAGYEYMPRILERLGAQVVMTGVEPDGMNINAFGGATKPHVVRNLTVEAGCEIGIALDGDADRAVFSDDQGRLINGDRTMAIWCGHWNKELQPKAVVGTVMTNTGFERYMNDQGVELHRAAVGDKYVSAKMVELGGKIGGEQSGHLIFSDHAPTGDGLITALELLRVLKRSGRKASEFYGDYLYWPQVLFNMKVSSKEAVAESAEIQVAIAEAEAKLGSEGRVNVRPSGTQPIVRVMVEATSYALRDEAAKGIVEAMRAHAAGHVEEEVDLTVALGD